MAQKNEHGVRNSAYETPASARPLSGLDKLWYTRCAIPTGLGLAMQQGRLAEEFSRSGIEIVSLKESDDAAARESHFDHSLRNSVRYGGSTPPIWARARGRDTRLLGVSTTPNPVLLLTTPGSGIASPKDLKGRRFGVPRWDAQQIDFLRAIALRGLEGLLHWHGLAVSDVELIDYPVQAKFSDDPPQRIPDTQIFGPRRLPGRGNEVLGLIRGEVDAIVLHGAAGLQLANQLHLATVADIGTHPDPAVRANNSSPAVLTVDAALLEEHPDVVGQILDQVLAAEVLAAQNPAVPRLSIARDLNVTEFWAWKAYSRDGDFGLRTTLDDESLSALQDFADFLHRWNFIERRLDVRDWVVPEPLAAARSRVAAI